MIAAAALQDGGSEMKCRNCGETIHKGVSGNVPLWFHANGVHQCDGQTVPMTRRAEPTNARGVYAGDIVQVRFRVTEADEHGAVELTSVNGLHRMRAFSSEYEVVQWGDP
jgi:hypothetical protein